MDWKDCKVLDDLVFDLCPSLSTKVRMRYNRTYGGLDETKGNPEGATNMLKSGKRSG